MKVTALIPDNLISDVRSLSKGRNITDSLIKALSEWVSLQKMKRLNTQIKNKPLEFSENFSAYKNREINRK